MKKTFAILALSMMLVLTLGFASAKTGNGVGNPDTECQAHGFDYGIAKYDCGSTTPSDTGTYSGSYTINVNWTDCSSVNWTATPGVYGVLEKESTDYFTYSGGTSGTINKQDHDISHITFCTNEYVVPEFGTVAGLATALGALGVFFLVRRK